MDKNKNLAEIYLNRNTDDSIFEKAKDIDQSCDKALQKEVNKLYWNSYSEFKQLLGVMNRYYEKGFTLTDYYSNILLMWGRGDIDKGEEKFNKLIDKVAEDIVNKITTYADVEVKEVRNLIIVQTLYKTYLGFLFEEYIKELLEREGIFNIEQSKELDKLYKIDLLVSAKGYEKYKIGLQLKSYTFEKIYRTYKQKYIEGNKKAINKDICKDVFYLLHSDNAELLKAIKILHSKEICNSEDVRLFNQPFEVAEEEKFIDELLREVFELYNKDNKINYENSFLSFFRQFDKEHKEQKFIEFKENIYKTKKDL